MCYLWKKNKYTVYFTNYMIFISNSWDLVCAALSLWKTFTVNSSQGLKNIFLQLAVINDIWLYMVSICIELSFSSQALWMSWFYNTGLRLMSPCLPWESTSDVGCVVQACSHGRTRIRGALNCRQATHTPRSLLMTAPEQQSSWSSRKSLQQTKFKSQWRNAVHLPEACREAHWSHCVFILSYTSTFCAAGDMSVYFLYLFVSIHIVIAGW